MAKFHSAGLVFVICIFLLASLLTYLVLQERQKVALRFQRGNLDLTNQLASYENFQRVKRDFMFASGANESDPQCFQSCNDEWKSEFEAVFNLSVKDYYDFPFHPKILDYEGYEKYCDISEKQTKCFIDKCNDQSADRVFSPSNFLCKFKRTMFVTARPCLEDAEPLNFLKCDQQCHQEAVDAAEKEKNRMSRANLGKVFSDNELDNYEAELSLLCGFQECYQTCHEEIVKQVCPSALANVSIELVRAYVQWHAADIYDWHVLSENIEKLPASCSRLTGYKGEDESILKIMSNLS
ncbi:unnamed protein product [Bursaphelenchus xylophilus]|uniref:(pine wood nematode) hypothetical protein n=1 Tax=Bursaphelenchus xylophilus TaxID=6326 RepID=A0A1I7S2E4_BURXY|nr:unnamed protein product [Bursaphelenchus xylophilus]CAG9114623.1 unnamed protein product [Bursaphelenchus xylophilus]